ncbi:MAG: FHA domain-containing protein [Phycisphaerales bacterium]
MAALELIAGGGLKTGTYYRIAAGSHSIGRLPGTRVQVPNPSVSRLQCVIDFDDEQNCHWITNKSATNPTLINGVQISGRTRLGPGDHITIGFAEFRYHDPTPEDVSISNELIDRSQTEIDTILIESSRSV